MKTALVLSAGGMFGAYQAGAYEAIAARTSIDMVIGVSVGALNGYAIASGCSPATLIERWRDPSAGATLKMYPDAGWRRGWFDPSGLREQAESLIRDFTPKIPFALAVVEIPALRTQLIRYPDVTAAHLAASCSIPLALPMVRIARRRYVDGGIFDKLPLRGAISMAATRIIAVDSLPRIGPWWFRAVIELARIMTPSKTVPQNIDFTLIKPSEPLGDVRSAVVWNRESIDRWIALGRSDTEKTLII